MVVQLVIIAKRSAVPSRSSAVTGILSGLCQAEGALHNPYLLQTTLAS